jgi:ubiquinone/menaquinone biosynthesis C-methylase UbiE
MRRFLEAAARTYFWKPGTAWFRALEVQTYSRAGVHLEGPTLDLGCGDGRVGRMLMDLGLAAGPLFGLDPSRRLLSQAHGRTPHLGLVRGDGRMLPFPDSSFASVLCNGVLCSIPGGPDEALAEIRRVLRPGGSLAATFPTDRFLDLLLLPRLFGFWPAAREAYLRGMNARQGHHTAESAEEWGRRFERAGLVVDRYDTFISRRAGEVWNVMSMHICRVVAPLGRLPPEGTAPRIAGKLVEGLLSEPFRREQGREGEGYLLMLARRG